MNKYLEIEYWNTNDLGNIIYAGTGIKFKFYLDANIVLDEPSDNYFEEGEEDNLKNFYPLFRRSVKKYLIETLPVPEYFRDMLYRLRLHDNIWITLKNGEEYQIQNLEIKESQKINDCYKTMKLTFDLGETIVVSGCN